MYVVKKVDNVFDLEVLPVIFVRFGFAVMLERNCPSLYRSASVSC